MQLLVRSASETAILNQTYDRICPYLHNNVIFLAGNQMAQMGVGGN